jgi:hypothetical protein
VPLLDTRLLKFLTISRGTGIRMED